MIRVLAFVISICCCIGLISGTYTAISNMQNDVTFTETVHLGDPAVLDGRRASFALRCGEHMLWETEYHFGPQDSHRTEFSFSQEEIPEADLQTSQVLSVYQHSGWGMSTNGSISVDGSGYADLFKTVIAMTAPGEKTEMNLKLNDFAEYHALNFELDYTSDLYVCREYVDPFGSVTGSDWDCASECYEAFCSLFRFPVQEDYIVTVSAQRNVAGGIISLDFGCDADLQVQIIGSATDDGVYCVPVYRTRWGVPEAIPGDHAQGMGIYFIPWKVVSGENRSGGQQVVTLDVEKAKNIYPLPDTAVVFNLMADPQTGHLWMLSLEKGQYVLTKADPAQGQILARLELMELDPDTAWTHAEWFIRGDLILVLSNDQLALVTDGASPRVEFIIPYRQVADGMSCFTAETGAMLYEDGLLYLADHPYYDGTLQVMVFNNSGPVYWGTYTSSLMECNQSDSGAYLRAHYQLTELE